LHYGPGVDSASNRNEYQEYFLGLRRPVRKADNLPPSCAVVTKSWNLNFLEPSGPVQVCNGTALSLPFILGVSCTRTRSLGYFSNPVRIQTVTPEYCRRTSDLRRLAGLSEAIEIEILPVSPL